MFKVNELQYIKDRMEDREKRIDLSRLRVTALDNNKKKDENINTYMEKRSNFHFL